MQNRRVAGFTMVELMFTIAVGLILVGIGVPSFNNLIKRNRITASVNEVITGFQLARSEAAKRGVPVTLCPTTNDASVGDDAVSCGGTDWHTGVLVFVDEDADGVYNNGVDELLRFQSAMQRDVFVNASAAIENGLTYGGDGFPNALLNASQLVFCDTTGEQDRRVVVSVSATGRPATARDVTVEGGLEC